MYSEDIILKVTDFGIENLDFGYNVLSIAILLAMFFVAIVVGRLLFLTLRKRLKLFMKIDTFLSKLMFFNYWVRCFLETYLTLLISAFLTIRNY